MLRYTSFCTPLFEFYAPCQQCHKLDGPESRRQRGSLANPASVHARVGRFPGDSLCRKSPKCQSIRLANPTLLTICCILMPCDFVKGCWVRGAVWAYMLSQSHACVRFAGEAQVQQHGRQRSCVLQSVRSFGRPLNRSSVQSSIWLPPQPNIMPGFAASAIMTCLTSFEV